MVSKLRRDSQGLISVRIGNHEFPVALRVGRKVYRMCPVCGAIFSSATGWKKHIDAYHPEFFDYVSTLRIKELMEIKSGIAETGKSCIDKLIAMIPDDAEIYYIEYNGQGYDTVGVTDKKSLINYLDKFTCDDIKLRMVRRVKGVAMAGRSKVHKYFKVPTGEGKAVRFTINQNIIEAMIGNRIIKPLQTQKQRR